MINSHLKPTTSCRKTRSELVRLNPFPGKVKLAKLDTDRQLAEYTYRNYEQYFSPKPPTSFQW